MPYMSADFYVESGLGKQDLVVNVPSYLFFNNFDYHQRDNFIINVRNPFQLDNIVVKKDDTTFRNYDYVRIMHSYNSITPACYFVTSIRVEHNIMICSVTLDVITTYQVLNSPVTGTITRKHVMPENDSIFGYPTALNIDANYTNELYDVVGYDSSDMTKLIESSINLRTISPAKELTSSSGGKVVIPVLPEPAHKTTYAITSWDSEITTDNSNAYTLYLFDLVTKDVLNTVRGLSGDGAISDSYMIPSEAVTTTASGSEVTNIRGRFLTKTLSLKLEIDFTKFNESSWTPRNKAILGMFKVAITSLQEKTRIEFPAWDLRNSVNGENYIRVNLWCDPKPSGAPYCSPDQVETLYPNVPTGINNLATLEVKSVRGGQWLRSPLIYNTGSGELFAGVETQLQREKAEYDKNVSMHQLNMSQKEREIRIAQSDYQYESGLASSIIGSGMSLLSKDFSGAFAQGKSTVDSVVNQGYIEQLRALQDYEHKMEKNLIAQAYSNNLKNLNVQESIRRVVPREIAYGKNDSMGSYDSYNSFMVSLVVPDIDSLKNKDLEYTLYGYPVYEHVENLVLFNGLYRKTHNVYQFDNVVSKWTGVIGDTIKQVLQSGIRIVHRVPTPENLLDNGPQF